MITREQVFPLLLEACPSFRARYQESIDDYGEELQYVHAGCFADYLLSLYRVNDCHEFPAIGAIIERFHVEGDDEVRTLATVGFLEGVQNGWSHTEVHPKVFLPFLGPVSTKAWNALYKGWGG